MNTAAFLKHHVGIFRVFPDERLQQLPSRSRAASFEPSGAIGAEPGGHDLFFV
jgi:hypothetical protein